MMDKLGQWLCPHDDELINQIEFPSEYDIIHQSGRAPRSYSSTKRTIITDYKCSLCGRVKRYKASSK